MDSGIIATIIGGGCALVGICLDRYLERLNINGEEEEQPGKFNPIKINCNFCCYSRSLPQNTDLIEYEYFEPTYEDIKRANVYARSKNEPDVCSDFKQIENTNIKSGNLTKCKNNSCTLYMPPYIEEINRYGHSYGSFVSISKTYHHQWTDRIYIYVDVSDIKRSLNLKFGEEECIYLYIKRFDENWEILPDKFNKYKPIKNGINYLDAKCTIDTTISNDETGETYLVAHERIGVGVYSLKRRECVAEWSYFKYLANISNCYNNYRKDTNRCKINKCWIRDKPFEYFF